MPSLNWIGKDKVVNHHRDVPFCILKEKYTFSPSNAEGFSSRNKIVHGDNLLALKSLLPEFEGKIKCIYIDPPYNTGNEGWAYNDNVNDVKIQRWLAKVVGKEGEDLTRHDKWLCMMYPRIKLLHQLLADEGAIFISIDDNEQANLRLMLDEIFGTGNFINNIIWQKKYSPQNDARYFSDMHDFIICYAKNKSKWSRNLSPRKAEQDNRYKNPDNDDRGRWKSSDLSVKTYSSTTDYPITTPTGRVINPPAGYCWRVSRGKFDEMVADNRIWFGKDGNNVPSIKRFLAEVQQGTVPVTLWLRDEVGDNQEGKQELKKIFHDSSMPFETPKPTRLIERIISIATDPGDIVLDSFAGSGTTGHAVLNHNQEHGGDRKFILVEMEDYAETVTAERIKRVINSKTVNVPNSGFSFYSLGPSLFNDQGLLNEAVGEKEIAKYIWFSETRSHFQQAGITNYYLGKHEGTGYYFIYQPDQLTTLDTDFLLSIKEKSELYIIYADNCLLSADFLTRNRIIFKKIPRDISRF